MNWVLGNYVACWKEILGTKFVIEYSSIFFMKYQDIISRITQLKFALLFQLGF
jgi:hypothetical protein